MANQSFCAKVKSRKGVIVLAWSIGLLIIAGLIVAAALVDRSWMLAVFILMSVVLSICVVVTIFARYVDSEKFPPSAYFNIGFTYFYSLMSIGILSVDLAFSLYNRAEDDEEALQRQESYHLSMRVLWNVIYWGSLVHGTMLNKFFSKYWTSGHFSVGKRIIHAIKNLLKLMIAGVVALVIFGSIAYFAIGQDGIMGVKTAVLMLANVYSMLFLVILLAYGLFNLPLYLWKCGDNQHVLYKQLEQADLIRKQYRAALVDFHTKVSQCKNLATNHKTEKNQELMDVLLAEMPQKDLEGQSIGHSQYFQLEIKKGQEISPDFIANVRYQFKLAYFMYKRKKAKWITCYDIVDGVVEKPIEFTEADAKLKPGFKFEEASLDDLKLKAMANSKKKLIGYRVLAVLALMFCLMVLITEATVIANPEKTLVYLIVKDNPQNTFVAVLFTIFFLAGVVLVCFFTIFNLKMSDYMQLVPNHTDCITFSSVTGMCCKIVTVSCFNYMTLMGEIAPGKTADAYSTSYVDFYSGMINVPFFGKYFNTIMPLFILIFGLLFAALSALNLKNKAVGAFQRTQQSQQEKEIDSKAEDSKAKANKKEEGKDKIDKKQAAANVMKEKIIKGEKAILAELDLLKKKEERKKLLKYNNNSKLNQEDEESKSSSKAKDKKGTAKEANKKLAASTVSKGKSKNLKGSIIANNKQSSIESEYGGQSSINKNDSDDEDDVLDNERDSGDELNNPFGKKVTTKGNKNQGDGKKGGGLFGKYDWGKKPIKEENKKLDIFRKAQIRDDSEMIEEENSLTEQLIPQGKNRKQAAKGSFNNARKPSEDSNGGDPDDLSRIKSFTSNASSTSSNGTGSRRASKRNKKKKEYKKEGYILKRKTKSLFGVNQWGKRYAVLENEQLILYEDHTKKVARKHIDMSKVSAVAFHYDQNAPVKSKKLKKKGGKDESRFDVYTPNRVYMLKSEGESLIESEWWVRILKECAKAHNPNYNSNNANSLGGSQQGDN